MDGGDMIVDGPAYAEEVQLLNSRRERLYAAGMASRVHSPAPRAHLSSRSKLRIARLPPGTLFGSAALAAPAMSAVLTAPTEMGTISNSSFPSPPSPLSAADCRPASVPAPASASSPAAAAALSNLIDQPRVPARQICSGLFAFISRCSSYLIGARAAAAQHQHQPRPAISKPSCLTGRKRCALPGTITPLQTKRLRLPGKFPQPSPPPTPRVAFASPVVTSTNIITASPEQAVDSFFTGGTLPVISMEQAANVTTKSNTANDEPADVEMRDASPLSSPSPLPQQPVTSNGANDSRTTSLWKADRSVGAATVEASSRIAMQPLSKESQPATVKPFASAWKAAPRGGAAVAEVCGEAVDHPASATFAGPEPDSSAWKAALRGGAAVAEMDGEVSTHLSPALLEVSHPEQSESSPVIAHDSADASTITATSSAPRDLAGMAARAWSSFCSITTIPARFVRAFPRETKNETPHSSTLPATFMNETPHTPSARLEIKNEPDSISSASPKIKDDEQPSSRAFDYRKNFVAAVHTPSKRVKREPIARTSAQDITPKKNPPVSAGKQNALSTVPDNKPSVNGQIDRLQSLLDAAPPSSTFSKPIRLPRDRYTIGRRRPFQLPNDCKPRDGGRYFATARYGSRRPEDLESSLSPREKKDRRNAQKDSDIEALIIKTQNALIESPEQQALRSSLRARRAAERQAEIDQRLAKEAEQQALEEATLLQQQLEDEAALAPSPTPSREQKQNLIRPLDPHWDEHVSTAMRTKSRDKVLAVAPNGTNLSRHDFGSLLPQQGSEDRMSGWLNDEIINAWFASIVARKHEQTGYVKGPANIPSHVAFNSQWYTSYKKKGDISAIATWSRRQAIKGDRLLSAEKIYFPVNTGAHWMLLIISPRVRAIEFLDSLNRGPYDPWFRLARSWLQMELAGNYHPDEWTELATSRSQMQRNSDDCGVFTCINGLASAKERGFEEVRSEEMEVARRNMAAVLMNGGFKGDFEL